MNFDPTYLLDTYLEDDMPEFPLMPDYTDADLAALDARIEWREEYPFFEQEPLVPEPDFDSEYDNALAVYADWYDEMEAW